MGPDGQMIAIEKLPFSWKQFGIGAGIPSGLILLPLSHPEKLAGDCGMMCYAAPILSLIYIVNGISTGRDGIAVGGIISIVLYIFILGFVYGL